MEHRPLLNLLIPIRPGWRSEILRYVDGELARDTVRDPGRYAAKIVRAEIAKGDPWDAGKIPDTDAPPVDEPPASPEEARNILANFKAVVQEHDRKEAEKRSDSKTTDEEPPPQGNGKTAPYYILQEYPTLWNLDTRSKILGALVKFHPDDRLPALQFAMEKIKDSNPESRADAAYRAITEFVPKQATEIETVDEE